MWQFRGTGSGMLVTMTLYSWNVHRIEHVGNVLSKGGAKKLGNIYVESEFDLTNLKKYISRKKIFWVSSWRVDFYCVDRDRHVDCVYYSVVQCVICHEAWQKAKKCQGGLIYKVGQGLMSENTKFE